MELSISQSKLLRRKVRKDIESELISVIAAQTELADDVALAALDMATITPKQLGEPSRASWAGRLLRVAEGVRLRDPRYKWLTVTLTDGHKTWNHPLAITIHLLTEKIMASNCVVKRVARTLDLE